MNTAGPVLEVEKVSKTFHDPLTIQVLKEVSFQLARGEFVSITGKSGCGKSTLLYILSTMDTDYAGDVMIDGEAHLRSICDIMSSDPAFAEFWDKKIRKDLDYLIEEQRKAK